MQNPWKLLKHWPARLPGIAVAAGILGGLLLRFYSLDFFEFKSEQAMIMLNGMEMPEKWFLITHGMISSVGVPNGPALYQLAGIFALLGAGSPEAFSAITAVCSAATIPALGWLLWHRTGTFTAVAAMLIAACGPIQIILATNIWPPNYLPLLMVGILALAVAGRDREHAWYWTGAVWLTALTGSIHLSAFFLGPGLLFLFLWRKLPWRHFLWAGLGAFLILSPWLYHLLFEWHFQRFPDPSAGLTKLKFLLWEYFGCFGGAFLQEYFGWDLITLIRPVTGDIFGWTLVALATIIPWIGIGRALAAWRRREPLPPVVTTAMILAASVLGGYLLLFIHVYYFYLFLPFPLLAIIAAHGFSRMRRRTAGTLLALWAAAALLLTGILLTRFDLGGGHPKEFGISYGWWRELRAELDTLREQSGPFQLQLRFSRRAQSRVDAGTLHYLFGDYFSAQPRTLVVEIDYDPVEYRYTRTLHLLL